MRYQPINLCIYCRSTNNLGDEHVVPFSLGGRSILPAASCASCGAVTSAFEGRCASINYGSFRIRENVQTRNPKKRPKEIGMISSEDGVKTLHMVPKEGALSTLPLFGFKLPGFLQIPQKKETGWVGAQFEVKVAGPRRPEIWKAHSAKNFSVNQVFDVDSHARLLAKIAHCVAVANLGIDNFEPWLVPYIMGEDKCLSYLVGGVESDEVPNKVLHNIKYDVWPMENQYIIIVKIRLFAQYGGPVSQVVVGSASEEMIARIRINHC